VPAEGDRDEKLSERGAIHYKLLLS